MPMKVCRHIFDAFNFIFYLVNVSKELETASLYGCQL